MTLYVKQERKQLPEAPALANAVKRFKSATRLLWLSVAPTLAKSAKGSKSVPLLLWLSVTAYTGFAVLLLSESRSTDQWFIAYMFMGNALLLIIGSVISFLGRVRASRICGLGVLGQIAILVGMLSLIKGGTGTIVAVNLCISGVFVGIMTLYIKQERKQLPEAPALADAVKRR